MNRMTMNRRTLLSRLAVGVAAPAAAIALRDVEPAGAVSFYLSGVVAAGGDYLNIRSGPSTARPLIYSAPTGTPLTLLQTSGDWFKVQTGGYTGWAHSGYVSVSGYPAKVLTRGIETRPRVALTFDAGSDA